MEGDDIVVDTADYMLSFDPSSTGCSTPTWATYTQKRLWGAGSIGRLMSQDAATTNCVKESVSKYCFACAGAYHEQSFMAPLQALSGKLVFRPFRRHERHVLVKR